MILYKKKPHLKSGRFLEQTILSIVLFLKGTIDNEEIASRKGFLQGCDPSFKCLSVCILLTTVLMTRSIMALGFFYFSSFILALTSKISPKFYLNRTLFFIPLFSFFIVIPALFNVVTPGESVFSFNLFDYNFSITRQGISSAAVFFLRVLSSVSFAILLVLTTRHHVLLKALRAFRIPQIFITTMTISYRYIYLLLDLIQSTFIAIKSRVGYITSTKDDRKIVGANMAGLWVKSYQLQTQVYYAMLSRGFTGEPKTLDDFHPRKIDFIIITTSIAVLTGTIWLNRYLP